MLSLKIYFVIVFELECILRETISIEYISSLIFFSKHAPRYKRDSYNVLRFSADAFIFFHSSSVQ